ncbi:MAG: VWA domain-containing protein, partial [Thermodesulfobacteriota bacterium]
AGAPETEKWVENPYLHQGEGAPYEFGLSVEVNGGVPLAELACPGHKSADLEYKGPNQARVTVKDDPRAGTKDFVLRYKLAGGKIQTGLLLYPGRDESFFLMMMEPPERVTAQSVVPREYIFIVDVSGSMNGFPLDDVAKPLMREIISGLRPQDLMNVLLFAGDSAMMSENRSLPATETNKRKAVTWLDSQQGGGGTEILPALKRALALPRAEGVSRIIVVVTDGYVSVEPQVFELIRRNLGRANLFAFGVGSSVNRFLIEGMARAGLGEPFVVLDPGEGVRQAARFRQYVESPVLTGIEVGFDGFEALTVSRRMTSSRWAYRTCSPCGRSLCSASIKDRPRAG